MADFELHPIEKVISLDDYILELYFEDGKKDLFDMKRDIFNSNNKYFSQLKDMEMFKTAKVSFGLDIV